MMKWGGKTMMREELNNLLGVKPGVCVTANWIVYFELSWKLRCFTRASLAMWASSCSWISLRSSSSLALSASSRSCFSRRKSCLSTWTAQGNRWRCWDKWVKVLLPHHLTGSNSILHADKKNKPVLLWKSLLVWFLLCPWMFGTHLPHRTV